MTEAKLAPSLPDWMVEHANRYLSSGGAHGHMYKMSRLPKAPASIEEEATPVFFTSAA